MLRIRLTSKELRKMVAAAQAQWPNRVSIHSMQVAWPRQERDPLDFKLGHYLQS